MITLSDVKLENISPEALGELLIDAKKAYYTTGKPIMDDHTYDTLEEVLRQKSPHHRLFSKVGHHNFDTGFEKKTHTLPMGSQNKVNSFTDLVHYFELKKANLSSGFIVQPKCDGISLEIEYQNGQLVDAVTRGDGIVGDVITQNVVKMKNFVAAPKDFSGSIRCEIMVTKKDFEKLNQLSTDVYSNPRNAASGISQRLDSQFSEYCSLYAVDISAPVKTEIDKIYLLKSLDFTPVETILCSEFSEIEKIYQNFLTSKRDDYPYEIDGLVIKLNDLNLQADLGSKNNRPKGQVAYKFPSQTDATQIKAVTWQVGPLGTITPVAEVEPIELAGAVITFASLANYDLIKEKNLNLGDIVKISRRGDVIPHIESVVTKVTPGHLEAPTSCPTCQTVLVIEDKYLRCPNTTGCLSQILGSLRLFCDTLEIKGLSDKTITKLYQANRIRLPGDFYKLTIDDIKDLENLGDKSAQKIINQIQSKKMLSIVEVFDAAIIPNFSAARIKQLIAAGFDTPEKILNLSQSEIESLPGFKKILADKVWQGINARRNWIDSILSQITLKKYIISSKFSGLNFCITGELAQPRKVIADLITTLGGKVQAGVTGTTDYLITNETESDSAKFVTAQKLGIKIISESEFQTLVS